MTVRELNGSSKVAPLPYDMGNAGDMLKHGVVSEFVEFSLGVNSGDNNVDKNHSRKNYAQNYLQHYLQHFRQNKGVNTGCDISRNIGHKDGENNSGFYDCRSKNGFTFYDPFGGRLYQCPPNETVVSRFGRLTDCALKRAQPESGTRYLGSGAMVRAIADRVQSSVTIRISDHDSIALTAFLEAGFEAIAENHFDPLESFSILECNLDGGFSSLLLLDPFANFIDDYSDSVPSRLKIFSRKNNISVVLFVLIDKCDAAMNARHNQFKQELFHTGYHQFTLSCPAIVPSDVRGETRYATEVLLLLHRNTPVFQLNELHSRLNQLAKKLYVVLPVPVALNVQWGY